jgi:hypothetical protein
MTTFDAAARDNLVRLETLRAARVGSSRTHARVCVARDLRLAPGTLENIRKKRTKGIRGWIAQTIEAALLRELQREIARLTHEYHVLVASGVGHRDCEMEQVAADLARVKTALEAMK